MTVQVPAKVLGGGVLDALFQPHQFHVLRHHVDEDIGGQPVPPVGNPLDKVGIAQGGDAHRPPLIVDLGVVLVDLELADHVAQLTQLPVAQPLGTVFVQHGDLVKGDLLHLVGEISVLDGQQSRIVPRSEDHRGHQRPHNAHHQSSGQEQGGDLALLFYKAEIPLGAAALKPGGHHGAGHVYQAQQEQEAIEALILRIEGRQGKIEVNRPHHQGDQQVEQGSGQRRANGLSGFSRPLRPGGACPCSLPRLLIQIVEQILKCHDFPLFPGGRAPPDPKARFLPSLFSGMIPYPVIKSIPFYKILMLALFF